MDPVVYLGSCSTILNKQGSPLLASGSPSALWTLSQLFASNGQRSNVLGITVPVVEARFNIVSTRRVRFGLILAVIACSLILRVNEGDILAKEAANVCDQ